ncbi:TonB-dependent receptor [Flavobacterium daejeonense]|nr:TonB-dependent receptor [Flavobacterium daejeonense]
MKDSIVESGQSKISIKSKDEKNRNVMLNADGNTGPRNVNIGLPFQGDIIILENDVPVVYTFMPQIPTTVWRYDNSLAKMGLLSFAEGALLYGKVGYAVNSSDREASKKFKGYASFYTNSWGSYRYDATITGPLGDKGWGYTLSTYENYDHYNGTNFMYTQWGDRTSIFKAGITKKYKNGNVRVLWKHSISKAVFGTYNPLTYKGNGETAGLDNFKLGRDSYILGDGNVPYYDANTGVAGMVNMDDDVASKFVANTFYLTGNHKFANGMNLTYSSMFMKAKAPFTIQFPVSLQIQDPDQQAASGSIFQIHNSNTVYNGSVQLIANTFVPQQNITTVISRAEVTKQYGKHSARLGFTQQYNDLPMQYNNGVYYQTVEPNPRLLDFYVNVAPGTNYKVTNDLGLLPSAGIGDRFHVKTKKYALYGSDDFSINKWWDLGLGARIELQNDWEQRNPYINQFILGRPLIEQEFKNNWNKVLLASTVIKTTERFGFLADVTYNNYFNRYADYRYKDSNGNPIPPPGSPPGTVPVNDVNILGSQTVLNYGGGIYYNWGSKLSIVSKITKISKMDNIASHDITNPANPSERAKFYPIVYDLETLGWTTDIVANPFKGFNIHYLLTLQNPKYKNYSYSAFGVNYDISNKTIPELSKVLMEVDPSYTFMKGSLRAWISFRYFGKQYANQTNAFFYKGWVENFGGLDYRVSRNIDFKFQVTNFLDQAGVKGAIQGADQITDATPYINRKVVAGSIRPRTFEFTVNFKF